jgi:flagellar motor protein MotB
VVAGFTWHPEGAELVGEYRAGLFDRGTHFRRGAARALTILGQRLAAAPHGLELRVVGTTDDLPLTRGSRYADNLDLGLARGVAVAGRLRRTAPLDSILVWVQGGASGAVVAAGPHRHGRSATLQLRATPASR